MKRIAPYWKAAIGFVAPGASLIIAAVLPGSDGGSAITQAEWITACATPFVTAAAVYAAPRNRPKPVKDRGLIYGDEE